MRNLPLCVIFFLVFWINKKGWQGEKKLSAVSLLEKWHVKVVYKAVEIRLQTSLEVWSCVRKLGFLLFQGGKRCRRNLYPRIVWPYLQESAWHEPGQPPPRPFRLPWLRSPTRLGFPFGFSSSSAKKERCIIYKPIFHYLSTLNVFQW